MANSGNPSSSPRRSWRAKPVISAASPGTKLAKRILLTALGSVLLLVFALVIWYFVRPSAGVYFVSLPVNDYSVPGPPPIAFCGENDDLAEFASLGTSVYLRTDPKVLSTSGHFAGMSVISGGLAAKGEDVLILYLSAHGVSEDGKAYVLCSDYDPGGESEESQVGRLELDKVLKQVSECPAKLKIILLDAGRLGPDARLGLVVNEFPRLLREVVPKIDDPNLWVLSANSEDETSQVCYPERRSIFAFFVAEGLKGRADGYGKNNKKDDQVDLNELWEFVRDHVSAWVNKNGVEAESQTPMLLWGGGKKASPDKHMPLVRVRKPAENAKDQKEPKPVSQLDAPGSDQAANTHFVVLSDSPRARRTFLANTQEPNETLKTAGSQKRAPAKASDEPEKTQSDQAPSRPPQPGSATPLLKDGKANQTRPKSENPPAAAGDEIPPGSEMKKAEPEAAAASKARSSSADQNVQQLLTAAWELRDRMETREGDQLSPIDYAPQLWRQFQEMVLGREKQYIAGADSARILAQLKEQSAIHHRLSPAEPKVLFGGLKDKPHSLAVAHLFRWPEDPGSKYMAIMKLEGRLQEIVNLTSEEFREEFRAWTDEPATEDARFASEVNFALRLKETMDGNTNDTDQRTEAIKLALETRQLGEKAAAQAVWCTPWVQKLVEDGDRQRMQGERSLFGVRESSQQAVGELKQAKSRYRSAQQISEQVKKAIELKNDLTFYAPYYVRTSHLLSGVNVLQLLQDLRQLTDLLEKADPSQVDAIKEYHTKLEGFRANIRTTLADSVQTFAKNPRGSGISRKIEQLLSTPLPRASQRLRLIDALVATDDEAAKKLLHEFKTQEEGAKPRPLNWQRIFDRAKLELELAKLAGNRPASSDEPEKQRSETWDRLSEAENALQAVDRALSEDDHWTKYREFERPLKQFYKALAFPEVIQATSGANRRAFWLAQERLLRLIDARDVDRFSVVSGTNRIEAVRQIHLFELLAWHQKRLVGLRSQASPKERQYLTEAAKTCYRLAKFVKDEDSKDILALGKLDPPPDDLHVATLGLKPPQSVRLDGPAPWSATISVLPAGNPQKSFSAVLDLEYDPRYLLIEPGVSTSGGQAESFVPSPGRLSGSFTLKSNEPPKTLNFSVKAAEASEDPKWLIARLRIGDRIEEEQQLRLTLPGPQVIHLEVPKFTGKIDKDKRTITLHPFPNRPNEFRLELHSPKPKQAKVQLLALPEPPANGWNKQQIEQSGILPDGAEPLKLKDPEVVSLAEGKPVAIALEKPEEGGRSITHGLLCIVEEQGLPRQTKSYYWIDIAHLEPREYLTPQFATDFGEGEVKIKLRFHEGLFPPGGSEVIMELLQDEIPRAKKVKAKLDSPNAEDYLMAKFDPSRRKPLLVRLLVDGYPRAFVYQMDVSKNRPDLRARFHEIRITSPLHAPPQTFVPGDQIPVIIEVDAPGQFGHGDGETSVEMEWTWTPTASEFRAFKKPLKFFANRKVDVILEDAKEDGTIVISPQVTDFKYPLPTAGLENGNIEITARLIEPNREPNRQPVSDRVLAKLDGTPPEKPQVDGPDPDEVERGQPLIVSAKVKDESPIDKVEFALCDKFDPDKFEKQELKKDGKYDEDTDSYTVTFPTENLETGPKGLRYTIMVRAQNKYLKDKWSDFGTKSVLVTPKRPPATAKAEKTGAPITGTALDEGQPPEAGAIVTLTQIVNVPPASAKNPPPVLERKEPVNKDSKFTFEGIPPGRYKIRAEAKHGAYTVSGEQLVTMPSPPAPQSVKLELKLQLK